LICEVAARNTPVPSAAPAANPPVVSSRPCCGFPDLNSVDVQSSTNTC
jgi:hypothetical protein